MLGIRRIIHKARNIFGSLRYRMREAAFIRHNRKLWRDFQCNGTEAEILLEATGIASSIVSCSYLANLLAKKHNAIIKAYIVVESKKKREEIYESFNAKVFHFSVSEAQRFDIEKLFDEVYPRLKTKQDVEALKIDGVWIGDLVYDSHLRKHLVPTLHINNPQFRESLKDALGHYLYWRNYLDGHNVKSVIVSHCVYYWYAIILRLAVERDIPVYQVNAQTLYYVTKSHCYRAYNDFFDYPQMFKELSKEKRTAGLKMAKERLSQRFAGEAGVDMVYSTKSAYSKKQDKQVLAESPRIKIFIAPHCFFDSPHPYGINLFPDYYEWLTFLGKISERTDYDWYIKTHPDFLPDNKGIIEGFIKRFPKFTFLPADTSHHQIIEDGINFALTVHGTIGFEYAALGVPVINASRCNPHIAYNFNIHPQSVAEYEKILLDLPNQNIEIDINEVYEYYYCSFINNVDNWLYEDYHKFLEEIGGYYKQVGPISYKKFLEQFSQRKHKHILRSLDNFVESREYCFRKKFLAFT